MAAKPLEFTQGHYRVGLLLGMWICLWELTNWRLGARAEGAQIHDQQHMTESQQNCKRCGLAGDRV